MMSKHRLLNWSTISHFQNLQYNSETVKKEKNQKDTPKGWQCTWCVNNNISQQCFGNFKVSKTRQDPDGLEFISLQEIFRHVDTKQTPQQAFWCLFMLLLSHDLLCFSLFRLICPNAPLEGVPSPAGCISHLYRCDGLCGAGIAMWVRLPWW